MRFKTSFLITIATNLTIVVIDKGAGFVLLWLLGHAPDEKGGLDLLASLPFILMAVANLGLAPSLVYFTRRKEVSYETAGETTGTVALVWGCVIGALAVAGIHAWYLIQPGSGLPHWGLLLPIVATTPFLLITSFRNSLLLVMNRIVAYNFLHLLPSLLFLPTFLVIYFLVTERETYYAGVYARLLQAFLPALIAILLLRRVVSFRLGFDRGFFKKAVSFGWRANLNSTLTYMNHRFDLYIVWMLFVATTPGRVNAEVAFYGLAVTLAEFIWFMPDSLRDLLFSRVAGLDEEEARSFTPVVCRNILFLCGVGALGIWLLHDTALSLVLSTKWIDKGWAAGVTPALAVLLPGTLFFSVAKILQTHLAARGNMSTCVFLTSTVFAIMLVFDVILVPVYGALGAAIASTVSYGVVACLTVVVFLREARCSWLDLLVPRREDSVHYRALLVVLLRRGSGA